MAWLSINGQGYWTSQMCMVTGPNIDIAAKLIKRLKNIFEWKLGIFDNKETVPDLNGFTIEAFPSNPLESTPDSVTILKDWIFPFFASNSKFVTKWAHKSVLHRALLSFLHKLFISNEGSFSFVPHTTYTVSLICWDHFLLHMQIIVKYTIRHNSHVARCWKKPIQKPTILQCWKDCYLVFQRDGLLGTLRRMPFRLRESQTSWECQLFLTIWGKKILRSFWSENQCQNI